MNIQYLPNMVNTLLSTETHPVSLQSGSHSESDHKTKPKSQFHYSARPLSTSQKKSHAT